MITISFFASASTIEGTILLALNISMKRGAPPIEMNYYISHLLRVGELPVLNHLMPSHHGINVIMTRVVSVTRKGQATIPKDLREKFKVGDRVIVVETEEGILFKPLPRPEDEFGALRKLFEGKTAKEILEEARI